MALPSHRLSISACWFTAPGIFFCFLRFGRCHTRLGPYNCVSSEKLFCTGTRLVRENGKSTLCRTTKNKQNHQKPKATRKSPSQICVSPQTKTAKQQRTGQGPTKTPTQICLIYSDISHRIFTKNMQTNYPLRQFVRHRA